MFVVSKRPTSSNASTMTEEFHESGGRIERERRNISMVSSFLNMPRSELRTDGFFRTDEDDVVVVVVHVVFVPLLLLHLLQVAGNGLQFAVIDDVGYCCACSEMFTSFEGPIPSRRRSAASARISFLVRC